MTEPLPNCFSIWPNAAANAFFLFSLLSAISFLPLGIQSFIYFQVFLLSCDECTLGDTFLDVNTFYYLNIKYYILFYMRSSFIVCIIKGSLINEIDTRHPHEP